MVAALAALGLLSACGGGGGGDGAVTPPAPPPVPASKVTLAANNYKNAVTLSMGVASSAYSYARLGVSLVDEWLDVPITFFPVLACPLGGSMSLELTDKNGDRSLDPGDMLHIHWDGCRTTGATVTGVVRVEVLTATQIPGGREYQLTITVSELVLQVGSQPATTVNFIAQVHFQRSATMNATSLMNAVFDSGQVVGDPGTSTIAVDYRQDYATQTYQYSVSGNVSSTALGGQVDFSTPTAFTGVIGEYPSSGRLSVSGNANSGARLSEEGAAAADPAIVFAAVDTNGDGTIDASEPQLAWSSVVPVQLFAPFADQMRIAVPLP